MRMSLGIADALDAAGLSDYEIEVHGSQDKGGSSENGTAQIGGYEVAAWRFRSPTGVFQHFRVEIGERRDDGRFLPIGPAIKGWLAGGKVKFRVEGTFVGSEEGREAWLSGFQVACQIATRIEGN